MPERIEPGHKYTSEGVSRIIVERIHEKYLIGIRAEQTRDTATEFELLVIQIGDGKRGRKSGWEYLPKADDWGRDGFTFRRYDECLNQIASLESKARSQVQYSFHFDTH